MTNHQLFSELDLSELGTKWTEEDNLRPQEDDPAMTMGGGGAGAGRGRGGRGGNPPNLSSGTASLDLFYNAASQEEDMPLVMEEGVGMGVGGGMVAMEVAKIIADDSAGGATMMQQ